MGYKRICIDLFIIYMNIIFIKILSYHTGPHSVHLHSLNVLNNIYKSPLNKKKMSHGVGQCFQNMTNQLKLCGYITATGSCLTQNF